MKTSVWFLLFVLACSAPKDPAAEEIAQAVCQEDQPPPCCPTCCDSPIVVDVAGDGLHLTDAAHGVSFALAPGHANQWSWTDGSDDAFLVLDVNNDGEINDGSELFGNHSIQASSAAPNGFLGLSWYDQVEQGGNGDGRLDASDAVWSRLRLWTDRDHDGWSAPGELTPVSTAVRSFSLAYKASTEADENGNQYKYRSTLVPAAGTTTSTVVTDAWLHTTPATQGPESCSWEVRCTGWVYIPIGNPFGMRCGNNPGGHGVPVYTLTGGVPPGQSYQAELFTATLASVATNPNGTDGLRREMTESARSNVRNLLINLLIANCQPAPFPVPDPYKTATEASSPVTDQLEYYSVACSQQMKCGGCGGLQ